MCCFLSIIIHQWSSSWQQKSLQSVPNCMTLQFNTAFHPVSISSLPIHLASFTSSLNQMIYKVKMKKKKKSWIRLMLTLIMESFVQSTSSHFIKDFIITTLIFFFFNYITINLLYTAFVSWTSYVAQYKYIPRYLRSENFCSPFVYKGVKANNDIRLLYHNLS